MLIWALSYGKLFTFPSIFNIFRRNYCANQFLFVTLHPLSRSTSLRCNAQMAESVDALVSNTSGATRAGSTPALATRLRKRKCCNTRLQHFFIKSKMILTVMQDGTSIKSAMSDYLHSPSP